MMGKRNFLKAKWIVADGNSSPVQGWQEVQVIRRNGYPAEGPASAFVWRRAEGQEDNLDVLVYRTVTA